MSSRQPRRYTPRSLYARAALILLVPVVALQVVVSVVFVQRLYEDVTRQMTGGVVLELARIVALIETGETPTDSRAAAAPLADALRIGIALPDPMPLAADRRDRLDLSGRVVIATLRDKLPGVRGVDLASRRKRVLVTMDTAAGPLGLDFDRGRVSASNPHQLLVLMAGTGMLITFIAFVFLRNQLRPITRLAHAAEAFGKGRIVPYRPGGAVEVRAAGSAFLDMRARIERQIEQRTLMLSGVSHDLRTPLTRLRLGLDMMEPSDETDALIGDVTEMEAMLNAFLDFAHSDTLGEVEQVDPAALAAEAAADARRAGLPVTLRPPARPGGAAGMPSGAAPPDTAGEPAALSPSALHDAAQRVALRPLAIRRALANLLGNAARYGRRVELGYTLSERAVVFTVEDDGPGISPEARDEALRPFARLDPSRPHNDGGATAAVTGGGVGLGLAIAIDIARQHGGTLRLGASTALGGLRADLVIAR